MGKTNTIVEFLYIFAEALKLILCVSNYTTLLFKVLGIYNFEFAATIVDHVMIFKEVFFSQVRKFTVQ